MYNNYSNKFSTSEEFIPLMSAPQNQFYSPYPGFPASQMPFPPRLENPWPQNLDMNIMPMNNPPQNMPYMRGMPSYEEREVFL